MDKCNQCGSDFLCQANNPRMPLKCSSLTTSFISHPITTLAGCNQSGHASLKANRLRTHTSRALSIIHSVDLKDKLQRVRVSVSPGKQSEDSREEFLTLHSSFIIHPIALIDKFWVKIGSGEDLGLHLARPDAPVHRPVYYCNPATTLTHCSSSYCQHKCGILWNCQWFFFWYFYKSGSQSTKCITITSDLILSPIGKQ